MIATWIERKARVRFFDLGDRTWHGAHSWRGVPDRLTPLHRSAAKSGSASLSPPPAKAGARRS